MSDFASLQLRYGTASFEAERWRNIAELLKAQLYAEAERWAASEASPLPAIDPLTPAERAQFHANGRYYGVYSRVARLLGKSANKVADVGAGRRSCRQTLSHIRTEMDRVDAEIAKGGEQA